MKEAVILFTRVPLPGKTKTRLEPTWTPEECAALHTAFLQDELEQCGASGREVFICFTPEEERPRLEALVPPGTALLPQRGDGLGERMLAAIGEVLGRGYGACVLAGADLPELTAARLDGAFAALKRADAVLLPTEDGGYGLIGMKAPLAAAFSGQTYGHATVLENTCAALERAGTAAAVLAPLADVDTPEDLLSLRRRLSCGSPACRRTAEYLAAHRKISVIVPVYNEERALPRLLRETEKLTGCELLFADGGSTDKTLALLSGQRVLTGARGRAAQMNLGAEKSGGDVLFFLHADSLLPQAPAQELLSVLERHRWGCFGVDFAPGGRLMAICARNSNRRVLRRGIAFGDQGIFLERDLFFAAGRFPDLPLMEDYQLSLNLLARGERPGMTASPIVTSSRRFGATALSQLRTMAAMARLRRLYRGGTDIRELARQYRDIR